MRLALSSILRESAWRTPERVAVVEGDVEVTYAELWEEAARRAAVLDRLGVVEGDRVALLAPNSVDFVTAYYAILATGAVVVPIPPMLVEDEIAGLLGDSDARLALFDAEFGGTLRAAAASSECEAIALRDGSAADLATRAAAARPRAAAAAREPLDPAVVFYTSGTTGRPKGAVLTQLNLVMNCFVNAFLANSFRREDVVLGCLPLFHTFGQTVALNSAFLLGARVVLQRRFDAREALDLMRRHGIEVMVGVPTMYVALLEALGPGEEAPTLRMCICGGAPLPVAVLEAFEARFGCLIQEGYGLSETSPTASVNHTELGVRAGSIGQPLWGVEVEIAAADVEDRIELLGPEEKGEIVIRGHNIFAGYLDRPEDTAAAMVDGWFRTGDVGVKDPDGFRHVVGRKKDLILRGGFNVYPREVEEVLARHPAIAQIAVVGIPHPTHGEEILAVVVAEPAATPSAEELLEWAGERVARHKRPRLFVFVDELPLGPTRKVLKRELRERFADIERKESLGN
ncbi:MAG: long-chain fatty acid--CoA ligase [Actinobacteria bacterium]|nr:long-chain fatty acid--CoA ligase [Actinomycetota bacterium]